ncbi:hypothetical protein CRENBAI_007487 [Crenichthys baileyi]|uniref:Uncharacterized protein n=1 Tax=Crenichthys baileyi TaxID=28760 RepID=A0AAV9R7B1_9TELE
MANYRTKRRRSGCLDVAVNAGKRGGHSTEGEPANKNIKKAKKGELNYLPNFPEGFNQVEGAGRDLVDEMQKRTPNGQLVKEKMDLTFALRRKEVVESEPAISEMLERWPALFTEDQVYMEFNRIVGKNLEQEFYDGHRGNVGQMLTQLSQQTRKTAEPTDIRTLVLRGLPLLLGDDPTDFYKQGFDSDDDDSFCNTDIGILLVEPEGAVTSSSLHLSPASLKITEGDAMHLNYPRSMKLTFQFIQQWFCYAALESPGSELNMTDSDGEAAGSMTMVEYKTFEVWQKACGSREN